MRSCEFEQIDFGAVGPSLRIDQDNFPRCQAHWILGRRERRVLGRQLWPPVADGAFFESREKAEAARGEKIRKIKRSQGIVREMKKEEGLRARVDPFVADWYGRRQGQLFRELGRAEKAEVFEVGEEEIVDFEGRPGFWSHKHR